MSVLPEPGSVVPRPTGPSPALAPRPLAPRPPGGLLANKLPRPSPPSQASTSTISEAGGAQVVDGRNLYLPSPGRASPAVQHASSQRGSPAQPALPHGGSAAAQPPHVAGAPSMASPALAHGLSNGLQSPTDAHKTLENSPAYSDITVAISNTSSAVLRQAIRDRWEKCLLGSEYHLAFLLNTSIHQASEATLARAIQDFGGKMIKSSKFQITQQLDVKDLDQIADVLLSKVSNDFLDKALARRLETIDGRELVNALARAERLGYDVGDIVERNDGARREQVIPTMQHAGPPPAFPSHVLPHHQPPQTLASPLPYELAKANPSFKPSQPQAPRQGPHGIVYCTQCQRPCSGLQALRYHQSKSVCNKPMNNMTIGKEVCPHCGCRFGSSSGLNYHLKSEVCGGYSSVVKDTIISMLEPGRSSGQVAAPPPIPLLTQSTPTQGRLGDPGIFIGVTPTSDPYASLTPEMRQQFEHDMKKGESKYGALMREAMNLPEPQRSAELTKVKNSYNTRQSITRKKYGIRLRERRTREQIDAERSRLFGTPDGPNLWDAEHRPAKKARANSKGGATATQHPGTASGTLGTPRKRVPIEEMGGLAASSATAELTDPTTLLNPSQPRFANQTPTKAKQTQLPVQTSTVGSSEDPMAIDSSRDEDDSDDETSDSSDDEDIPAQLSVSRR